MGIKFYCPNGHKLNVKSFLSGKRAICPKCGARVVVPSLEEPAADNGDSLAEAPDQAEEVLAASFVPPTARGEPVGEVARPPNAADAIAEAPSAVWYVRPATGSQFGPASAEIMRAWLNEGRVGTNSLVWRAGWPEWRAAATVFPHLAGPGAAPELTYAPTQAAPSAQVGSATHGANGPLLPSGGSLPHGQVVQSVASGPPEAVSAMTKSVPPLAQSVRRRRRQHDARLIFSAVLVVLSIILMIILAVVWRRQGAVEESPVRQAPAAAAESMM